MSADNLNNKFTVSTGIGPFDTMFWKELFEKFSFFFKKKSTDDNKKVNKLPSMQWGIRLSIKQCWSWSADMPAGMDLYHFEQICLFVWFDSLRPLNNLSVMRDGLPGLNQY